MTKYSEVSSNEIFDPSNNDYWYHIYYDKYLNNTGSLYDPVRRKKIDGKLESLGIKAKLVEVVDNDDVTEKNGYQFVRPISIAGGSASGNAEAGFSGKYLIDGDNIVCKYYITNIDRILPIDTTHKSDGIRWSTIVSIWLNNGEYDTQSHEVYTAYQLFLDIYGYNSDIWGKASKGIKDGNWSEGKSAANDFDNILTRYKINEANLHVNYYVKTDNGYELIPTSDLYGNVLKPSQAEVVTNLENNVQISMSNYSYRLYGTVEGKGDVPDTAYETKYKITNNANEINYNKTKYKYKYARFGYDSAGYEAANLNLSEKKGKSFEFCGGAEYSVVNFYYDPAEEPPRYKIKYVDESGNEIATSSSEMEIPKSGKTVEKKSIDGYRYKGVLTSKVDMGSLSKASVDVKNVTDTNSSKYISYGKQDVLVVFVYSKITYYLRVQHAIYNDTGENYENLLSLIDINKDFKQEVVTNTSSKSLINNAYYQYILKSNKTNVKLSEKEYKTTNALYKFNSMYFLRKMDDFPDLKSTYESGDGKNEMEK